MTGEADRPSLAAKSSLVLEEQPMGDPHVSWFGEIPPSAAKAVKKTAMSVGN